MLSQSLSPEVVAALAKLPDADRRLAESQRVCPVANQPLGSMGKPIKVDVNGKPVFICCEGCRERLLGEPKKYLAKLASFEAGEHSAQLVNPTSIYGQRHGTRVGTRLFLRRH